MVFSQSAPDSTGHATFGRTGEISTLSARARAACAGRAGIVVVSGPTGMGKSSLLEAFSLGPGANGMTVLRGKCAENKPTAPPYSGVRALYGALGTADGGAAAHPLLRGIARHAMTALGPVPPDGSPFVAGSASYRVFQALHRLTVDLVTHRPLALVLDDAHLCDEHSLRWIEFLLRRADGLPLLVVLARRGEGEPADNGVWPYLTAHPECTSLVLGPPAADAIGELARHVYGGPVDPSFAERVADVCGRVPGRAARLLHALRSEGTRPDADGGRRALDLGTSMIASSVRELLERKPAWMRAVATSIAVLDGAFPEHVAALAGVSTPLAREAVALLREAGALAPGRTEPVHDAVRTAVLAPLGAEALTHLRKRAALLLSDAGRPAREAARHLMDVPGTPEPWMSGILRDAATEATDRGAPVAAARYLHQVLEAEPDDDAVRLRLGDLLARTDPGAAVAVLRGTLERAADVRTRAGVAVPYATACLAAQQPAAARQEAAAALGALGAQGAAPGPDERRLRTALESVLLLTGPAGRTAAAAVLKQLASVPGHPRTAQPHPDALGALVAALYGGTPEPAVRYARQALTTPSCDGWPLLASVTTLALADETDEALRALDPGQRPEEAATGRPGTFAQTARAIVLYGTGALDDSVVTARAALDAAGEPGSDGRLVLPRLILAAALTARGEAAYAEDLLAETASSGPTTPVLEQHLYLMARARARRALGDGEAALGLLRAGGRAQEEAGVVNPVLAPWWADACHVLAALHRPDEAREYAEFGTEAARRWGTPRALGIAALARGVLASPAARTDLLAEAAAYLGRSPARADHARAEYELGRALLHHGDERAARRHLRAAADLAGCCGALPLARAARRRLIAAGGRMGVITGSRADLLTGAERKVVGLVLLGASNRRIAQQLCVTLRTVETHLTSVYRKLGVKGREQLGTVLRTPGTLAPRLAEEPGPAARAS
ncbi:AAA family ATPase [Streptomyces sp. NPDC016566]|uniref:helix-turn-helix transcriptional regulator n=2 Tax=Streptomyces TaxID=1883 RepID=UPI0016463FF7|nr:LuxR family transcriptional regulator [Streptomyces sp. BK340]